VLKALPLIKTAAHIATAKMVVFFSDDFILFLLQWLFDVCTVEDRLSSSERYATNCRNAGLKLQISGIKNASYAF
jgi:hypothetical protein